MGFLDYFRSSPRNTASVAKERLQIIVAHERRRSPAGPDFLPMLQKDLLDVVRKYIPIDEDQIKLSIERNGDCEVLELNIALSEGQGQR